MSKHVHFIGIGGSGMSAVAQIAQNFGFTVSGCDIAASTPYLEKVKKAGIKIFLGHHPSHLENVDLVAVTPAMFYQNQDNPELVTAQKLGILKKWQELMGQDLHRDKFVIAIAGTHGKSTTTAWAGQLLKLAGLDPTVEVGATVNAWQNNILLGKSKYFVCEADEFDNNFASYHPDIVILTMIELDHPEYFGTYKKMLNTYEKFLSQIKPGGSLIYNQDSPGCIELLSRKSFTQPHFRLIPYSLKQTEKISLSPESSSFRFRNSFFQIQLPGHHNIQNSLGVICLGNLLHLNQNFIKTALKNFTGTGRRLEFLGQKGGIKVYDDYANHPSSFKASIDGVIQQNPHHKIIAVIEPHTFSRLKALLHELPTALQKADQVIFTKIFASRETDPGNFSGQDLATAVTGAWYLPENADIIKHLQKTIGPESVVLVMGSGNSHLLSREIFQSL